MFTKYIYSRDDSVTPFIDLLGFDPLYWLGEDKITMGQLFELARPCEDEYDKGSKAIRYMDDDVCFEIKFEYLDGGVGMIGYTDEVHADWQNFYKDDAGNVYHILHTVINNLTKGLRIDSITRWV